LITVGFVKGAQTLLLFRRLQSLVVAGVGHSGGDHRAFPPGAPAGGKGE
jgi:hypothetical protein